MAVVDIKSIRCPQCKSKNQVHIYKSVNAQEDLKLHDKILTGELFDFYCPYCEYKARLYYPCLYNDPKNRFMVYFIPDIEKGQMIDRTVEMEYPDLPKITKRIVPTFNEFKEKILIFEAGLDDMAIELTKAAVAEAVARKKEQDVNEGYFSLYDKENNTLGFTFFLGIEHTMFTQTTKLDVYRKSWSIVSRLGKKERSMKGFIKIDKAWADNILFRYQRFGFDSN
ncbi:MAG TPA: hypothetical protein GX401_08390 [Clostridiales bacterium]|nr:hypothetical protein [Clostridiales bacterium]